MRVQWFLSLPIWFMRQCNHVCANPNSSCNAYACASCDTDSSANPMRFAVL